MSDEETAVVYLTNAWQSAGILEQEVRVWENSVFWKGENGMNNSTYGENKNWHRRRESAVAHVKAQIRKKRESLHKQLERLAVLEHSL